MAPEEQEAPLLATEHSHEKSSRRAPPALTWLHVTAIAFYTVGGPFGFEESLNATRSPALSFWALIAMALFWALPQSMLIAELSTLFNHGYTEWVIAGLGTVVGTAHGWMRSVCNIATNVTYCALFSDYFVSIVFGATEAASVSRGVWIAMRLAAVVPYVGVILLGNLAGVRLVGWASVAFTVAVIAPFVAMFALAAPKIDLAVLLDFALYRSSSSSSSSSLSSYSPWSAVTSAQWNLLVGVLVFNLIGWDDVGNLATRVKKIQRDMPVGISACLALVLATYIAPLLSISAVMTPDEYGVDMYEETCRRLWKPLGSIMSADSLLGIFGLGFVYLTTSSEAQAHCSVLGLYPKVFGRRTKRGNSPWLAMVLQSAAMLLITPFSSFGIAVEIQSWFYTLSVFVIGAGFLALRWRNRGKRPPENSFHIPLPFWALALCALPMLLLCAICICLSSWTTLAFCPAFVLLLVLLSWILHKRGVLKSKRIYETLATAPPEDVTQVATDSAPIISCNTEPPETQSPQPLGSPHAAAAAAVAASPVVVTVAESVASSSGIQLANPASPQPNELLRGRADLVEKQQDSSSSGDDEEEDGVDGAPSEPPVADLLGGINDDPPGTEQQHSGESSPAKSPSPAESE